MSDFKQKRELEEKFLEKLVMVKHSDTYTDFIIVNHIEFSDKIMLEGNGLTVDSEYFVIDAADEVEEQYSDDIKVVTEEEMMQFINNTVYNYFKKL